MPRTFVGWSFPTRLRDEIGRTAAALREKLPAASWTRSETYHLTFAFLGEQNEESLARLVDALVPTLREVPAARSVIGDAGFFPSGHRPRVGWLGLGRPEGVTEIAEAVRRVLVAERTEFDPKPFHPHLTIARPKTRWNRSDVETFLAAWQPLRGRPLLVDAVTLFESRLGSGGARHIPRVVATLRRECDVPSPDGQ